MFERRLAAMRARLQYDIRHIGRWSSCAPALTSRRAELARCCRCRPPDRNWTGTLSVEGLGSSARGRPPTREPDCSLESRKLCRSEIAPCPQNPCSTVTIRLSIFVPQVPDKRTARAPPLHFKDPCRIWHMADFCDRAFLL